ncbi:hypothetical protein PHYSODRAFT_355241 [Phytophthora sojae]|uniref:Uncharacterized protein n=1 Tax=Phytophthora sojae (strain P6497) TaxID=1094619 RepID=G4ZZG1_PHYSP|nr:hypothetical protein PHYSODRAFT_355241 [Phytophthora sojae]EGZ10361.1 hypothetical protein PHYSODRAFT_355241 [Phytophthora sojae]|eukprot:XP_009533106.1 hypothetical protein PHYSODRAFT_355241 [Phytophthora sojae]
MSCLDIRSLSEERRERGGHDKDSSLQQFTMLSPRQRSDALPVVEAALALISLPGRLLSWRSLIGPTK